VAERQTDPASVERPPAGSAGPGRPAPLVFDVFVVRRDQQWMVGLFGHPLLVCWRSYEVAKARARDFAHAQGVDVWLVGPDASFERLVRHR